MCSVWFSRILGEKNIEMENILYLGWMADTQILIEILRLSRETFEENYLFICLIGRHIKNFDMVTGCLVPTWNIITFPSVKIFTLHLIKVATKLDPTWYHHQPQRRGKKSQFSQRPKRPERAHWIVEEFEDLRIWDVLKWTHWTFDELSMISPFINCFKFKMKIETPGRKMWTSLWRQYSLVYIWL